ncbi:MAG TPA: sulfur transferase domain-containing protein, partial [Caulobacter sp.]|nr:sulfur transferase domain-containing protein [Caulobacter sp.]
MDIRPLDEALSASPQIAPEDLPAIAAQGFRSVISNRPDGEEPGQPSAEALRQAAEAAGLAFA